MTTQPEPDETFVIPQHAGAQPVEQLALEIWKSCLMSALNDNGNARVTEGALKVAAARTNQMLGKVLGLSPRT